MKGRVYLQIRAILYLNCPDAILWFHTSSMKAQSNLLIYLAIRFDSIENNMQWFHLNPGQNFSTLLKFKPLGGYIYNFITPQNSKGLRVWRRSYLRCAKKLEFICIEGTLNPSYDRSFKHRAQLRQAPRAGGVYHLEIGVNNYIKSKCMKTHKQI